MFPVVSFADRAWMTSVQGTDFWASFLKHFKSQPRLLKSSELPHTSVHKVTQLGLETQGQENILALLPTRVAADRSLPGRRGETRPELVLSPWGTQH